MSTIKPGLDVRVMTSTDATKEKTGIRGSTIHDVRGTVLILAQTDPPLTESMLYRDIVVTYTEGEESRAIRYGFPATVTEFIDYSVSPERQIKAIVVDRRGEPTPYSVRMYHRVGPTVESRLHLFIGGTRLNVLDISLGGTKFSYDTSLKLHANAIVEVYLDIGTRTYTVESRILRTSGELDRSAGREIGYASAEFLDMTPSLQRALSLQLRQMERTSREANEG